jgi:hypothetical protein
MTSSNRGPLDVKPILKQLEQEVIFLRTSSRHERSAKEDPTNPNSGIGEVMLEYLFV